MKKELAGNIVFDASVIVELLSSTKRGKIVKEKLKSGEVFAFTTELDIAEALYILCRKIGFNNALIKINALNRSGYIEVFEISPLIETAALYKCNRAIALSDCFTLSLAKYLSLPVLFARKEKELLREIEKEPFDVEILFLEELV